MHLTGLTFMGLFTLVFYGIFARFREQACTFICPYGRFQSTLLDENTIVVAYDYKRGEKRGRFSRNRTRGAPRRAAEGIAWTASTACAVCPTGIDIRNGTQMECVNCTACIDACDDVMAKIGRPRGLIRFASLNGIEKNEPIRVTPRIIGYCVILALLGVGLVGLLLTRSDVDVTFLRAPGRVVPANPRGEGQQLVPVKTHQQDPLQQSRRTQVGKHRRRVDGAGRRTESAGRKANRRVGIWSKLNPAICNQAPLRLPFVSMPSGKPIDKIKTIFIGPRR